METLSDKRHTITRNHWKYSESDVKEFIRELKEELNVRHAIVPVEIIDKLAGDKLI